MDQPLSLEEIHALDPVATFSTGRVVDGELLFENLHRLRLEENIRDESGFLAKHWGDVLDTLRKWENTAACRLVSWRAKGQPQLSLMERNLPLGFFQRRKGVRIQLVLDTRTEPYDRKYLDRKTLNAIFLFFSKPTPFFF